MPDYAPLFSRLDTKDIRQAVIFLDVDGTLVADRQTDVPPDMLEKIRELARENSVYLCSNGSHGHALELAKTTSTNAIQCRKPISKPMRELVSHDKRTIVIGDKYLTDGLLASALHGEFIKVERVRGASDSLSTKLTYLLDNVAWKIQPYVRLMRPWHWVKNLLVLAPLFFAGKLTDLTSIKHVVLAFVAFCLTASIVYVLNDLYDRDRDREHPTKRFRPIAANEVTTLAATLLAITLMLMDLALVLMLPSIAPWLLAYLILNQIYSQWIKHVAVADVVCVSIFYLLRILVGGVAAPVPLSSWIILCTLFGSLFIIIGKRRAEYRLENRRAVLADYSSETLDMMLVSSVTLSVISYGIWSIVGHPSNYLVYSTLFVLFAVFRTLNRIYSKPDQAESPQTLVFKDPWIFGSFVLWLAYVFVIFYTHA